MKSPTKPTRPWLALLLLAILPTAFADEVEDAIALARAARADGVPEAAIHRLKRAAAQTNATTAPALIVELARCLLAANREKEAIRWMRRTVYRADPNVVFWRAQALAQAGDHAAALADYEQASRGSADLRADADLGRARMLEALGRPGEALEVYAAISADSRWHSEAQLARAAILIRSARLDEARALLEAIEPVGTRSRQERGYLLGRIALETGRAAEAGKIFDALEPRNRRLAAGAAIGAADVLSRAGANEAAELRLEAFVREDPRNPLVGDVLAKHDELRGRRKDLPNAILKQWEKEQRHAALSAAATYYLARSDERQGRADRAIRTYEEFIKQHPHRDLRPAAAIRLARMQLAAGRPEAAARALAAAGPISDPADEARLRFLRGATEHQARNPSAATKNFVRAANLDPALAEDALANAALSSIDAGNDPLAAEILSALRKQSPASARRIELAQAFKNARAGAPDAAEQLAALAEGGGAVGGRARLALAEWIWRSGDRPGARAEFQRVANSAAAGDDGHRDYFAVYLADDGSAPAAELVAAAARDFLARHPDSPREADVRMKWGEVLMRTGDYLGARVQFERAAESTADPSRRQSALFLAARAAAGSMVPAEIEAAIALLDEVAVARTGDLAVPARWEQAKLQSALGRFQNSVAILDEVLAATKDPRLRFAARLKKGDALQELGRTEPAKLTEAIQEWRAIADSPDALPAERNEALTHAAAASEQAGDADAALAAYYEVLTAPRDRQPEYFWYYKAGFSAAQLLLERERPKEAVAIYEKMAASPGPRAKDAEEQVKRLRLQNFIWED